MIGLNTAEFWSKVSKGYIQARYISPFSIILHAQGIYPKIGKGVWIGHWTVIDGSQGLEIGVSSDISCGVHIYSHSTALRGTLGKEKETGSVKVGDNVFIGPNSVISMGCQIGEHAIIAPLSYLDKNTIVEPYSFWAGIPATLKKRIS